MTKALVGLIAICALSCALPAGAASRPGKKPVSGVWLNGGVNQGWVQDSAKDCLGAHFGLTIAKGAYLRWQRTNVTFEESDSTDSCDALFAGDTGIEETSLTGGFMLGRSTVFLGLGPAWLKTESDELARDSDTGLRLELGWSGRGMLGLELVLSRTFNDIRDYTLLGFGITLGSKR